MMVPDRSVTPLAINPATAAPSLRLRVLDRRQRAHATTPTRFERWLGVRGDGPVSTPNGDSGNARRRFPVVALCGQVASDHGSTFV